MKLFVAATTCFVLIFSAMGVTKDDPSITVTGEAVMRVPADRAYIALYTDDTNNKAETAITESFQNIENTLKSLKSNKNTDYVVVNTGVSPIYGKSKADTSYLGAHCIRISCSPEDEDVFKLIDDATKTDLQISPSAPVRGSLPFSPIIYAVEDYADAEADLETQAMEDAKKRAKTLAERADKALGEIISIQTDLIPAAGRSLDLPTPYISNNRTGVMMRQTITASYQLLPKAE